MRWRPVLRFGLVVIVAAVGVAVFRGLQSREQPATARSLDLIDPDAVIQTRGSRIIQADPLGENLEIVSGSQSTYADGAMRLFDGVEVAVADREDRKGFELSGQEAHVGADQTRVQISGAVRMQSSDGLFAETDAADYTDDDGVIRMPGFTTFERGGLTASGDRAEYDRSSEVLQLFSDSHVQLGEGAGATRIDSRAATLAQAEGSMRFVDDVRIARGEHRMVAQEAHAVTVVETNDVQSLELGGDAALATAAQQPGGLREMSARSIHLTYAEGGDGLERSTLTDAARLEVVGVAAAIGTQIRGQTIDIRFSPDGTDLRALTAEEDVTLDVPGGTDQMAQVVAADTLTLTSTNGAKLDEAHFNGAVEFRESERLIKADTLQATLADGLSGLETANFSGDVQLENGDMVAYADVAIYAVASGEVELRTGGVPEAPGDGESGGGVTPSRGRAPRLEDARRGTIQARTIGLGLNDGHVSAMGDVESVLAGASETEPTSSEIRRPGMLNAGEPVYVRADALAYDDDLAKTTYTGGARLWQSVTKFVGQEIVLDEAVGNISASGMVETESLISQINVETGLQEESLTRGFGETFIFEDDLHRATYTGSARMDGPRGDLKAAAIRLFLESDGRTLERIEAEGAVDLTMTTQWVSGDTLTFHDADGRYEMTGEPVRLVERAGPACRETTGRRLTFFITEDAVSVDGESEVRTAAADITCPPQMSATLPVPAATGGVSGPGE